MTALGRLLSETNNRDGHLRFSRRPIKSAVLRQAAHSLKVACASASRDSFWLLLLLLQAAGLASASLLGDSRARNR